MFSDKVTYEGEESECGELGRAWTGNCTLYRNFPEISEKPVDSFGMLLYSIICPLDIIKYAIVA